MKRVLIFFKDYFHDYGKVSVLSFFIFVAGVSVFVFVYSIPSSLQVSFIDVGQGDAVLIISPSGKKILVDGGPNNRALETLSKSLPFFSRHIDAIIATHPDADHITGLVGVLDRFDVDTIILSATGTTNLSKDFLLHAYDEKSTIHIAKQGDIIDFHDGALVRIVSPKDGTKYSRDTNASSISVLVEYNKHSFLLTGDLPVQYEAQLLSYGTIPKHVTVFKAGHHGSNTSNGEQLLSYIRPEYAVISAGKDNRYGHPNKEALARLEKYSKEILSTIDRGTISFISDGRLLRMVTEK